MVAGSNAEVLALRVRTLEKYKHNYELLCSQLGELNTQVSLQLQRHEMDVAAQQTIIRSLEKDKAELLTKVAECEAKVETHVMVLKQDKEYTECIHQQLTTATELLKTTERNHAERERETAAKLQFMQHQLNVEANEKSVLQRALALAEEKLRQPPPPPQLPPMAPMPQPLAPTFEAEYQTLVKEHKKLKRRLDEQQSTIHTMQGQLKCANDERDRLAHELESARHHHTAQLAPLQQELVHLRAVHDETKAHAQALECQLDQVELQKQKWKSGHDKRLWECEVAADALKTQHQSCLDERNKTIKALELKVREVKGRWKADRDKLKAQRDAIKSDCATAMRTLQGELHEYQAQSTLAQQKNVLLTQELHTLQEVLAQIQAMEDNERDSLVGRARQRVLSDRHILEAAIRDHVNKNQAPLSTAPTSSSTWSYAR
ncbi:hypothetical protein DYB32_006810 [Aphanomyces invadans]|uniref:Uncharacterized protein n=1 Tax=Aphanomyces invadans TaxID=157072 RepID=A0A418AQV4_9STRA|nr:hypothetical protein DYB32_006810 [Aphanomyces invadans]